MTDRHRRQEGQAALLALVAVLLAALLTAGVVRIGTATTLRAHAQAAADAAALAGAADGRDAAGRIAASNGAELVDFRLDGLDVQVTVEHGGVHATARARWDPRPIP